MGTRNSRPTVPTWVAGLVVVLTVAVVGYVVVYGGELDAPVFVLFGTVGVGVSTLTLYLLYRFVVAVETIAEKH
jgi:hypothetical protein